MSEAHLAITASNNRLFPSEIKVPDSLKMFLFIYQASNSGADLIHQVPKIFKAVCLLADGMLIRHASKEKDFNYQMQ